MSTHPDGWMTRHLSGYWACTRPEAPRTECTWYDDDCRACVWLAQAHVVIQGDYSTDYYDRDSGEKTEHKMMSEHITEALAAHPEWGERATLETR